MRSNRSKPKKWQAPDPDNYGRPKADITHPLGRARLKAGVPRTVLAAEIPVSYQTLWRWEIQQVSPPAYAVQIWEQTLARLIKLAKSYKANVA